MQENEAKANAERLQLRDMLREQANQLQAQQLQMTARNLERESLAQDIRSVVSHSTNNGPIVMRNG